MNILVIYDYYAPFALRQTFADYLYSFGRYSNGHHVYYCNYSCGIPGYLKKIPFDLIIFQQGFACQFRWGSLSYENYIKEVLPLKSSKAIKVIFCQDEFLKMDRINRFVKEFGIDAIFSVAEESEWNTIYYDVDRSKVRIYKVLTGYLDDHVCETIDTLAKDVPVRDIDIGYRATHAEPWLGKIGLLKIAVADIVDASAKKKGLKTDISTVNEEKKFFLGLDWYRFMLRCKNFIGVEGGSSLFDTDGTVREKITKYQKQHPRSTYDQVEAACFPGMDGNINIVALSPRHLEACVTRTCQILVEGEYSGVLKPGIHYISLKKDFSNVDDALAIAQNDKVRKQITDNAYQDIVQSQSYTYSAFVSQTFSRCFEGKKHPSSPSYPLYYWINRARDWLIWKRMPLEFYWFKKVKKFLPTTVVERLKALRNRS